jgi:hypothetical protein
MTEWGERLGSSMTRVVEVPFPFDLASKLPDSDLRMGLNEQAQGGFDYCFLCG